MSALRPRQNHSCGQHAASLILAHWGLGPRGSPAERRARLYARFPPDTFLKLLGTSPARLAEMLEAHGLEPSRVSFREAEAARSWLVEALRTGPVALLVDLRPLGSRVPLLHWVVATRATPGGVVCENLVRSRFDARSDEVPWPELLHAWRCRVLPLPSRRHAAVLGAPRRPG